jgi:hypothetical protein
MVILELIEYGLDQNKCDVLGFRIQSMPDLLSNLWFSINQRTVMFPEVNTCHARSC